MLERPKRTCRAAEIDPGRTGIDIRTVVVRLEGRNGSDAVAGWGLTSRPAYLKGIFEGEASQPQLACAHDLHIITHSYVAHVD